jgi:hypothetical protein
LNTIVINGVSISAGRSITVSGNRVFVDGKDMTPDAKDIKIEIAGRVEELRADACNTITISGDAGSVTTQSGDVRVGGNIGGSVQTMSGDVESDGFIAGSVSTMSGNVRSRR